jgi:hypothetical protein
MAMAFKSCWLLEVRARQVDVPTPAQSKAPDPLREAALHTCPQGILGFEFLRLLALPRRLDGLVVVCGRTVSWRGAACAEVQARRVGHARQGAPSNRMRMTGSPETSRPGRQWTLACP